MSDLERELAHATKMATATHKPECSRFVPDTRWMVLPGTGRIVRPNPDCPGCVTDTDRTLWTQLAGEYQAQLDRHRMEETLL